MFVFIFTLINIIIKILSFLIFINFILTILKNNIYFLILMIAYVY